MDDRKSANGGASAAEPVSIAELAAGLTQETKNNLMSRYDMKKFARIFEDGEITETCLTFFSCGLNVSLTARKMYMHRNTLIYRLDKVRHLTGLDLRGLEAAVTFELLYRIYSEKRGKSR